MTNITKYRNLCRGDDTIPLFSKDWWFDIVCEDGRWDVALVEEKDRIIAALPYYLTRQYGLPVITMPQLTQTMGPWIHYPKNLKCNKKLSFEKQVMVNLIDQVPRVSAFKQNFHHIIKNWLPFYWKGFNQTTRYTYILNDLSNLDNVYSNFQSHVKRNIKKASNRYFLKVIKEDKIDVFLKINEKGFLQKGIKTPYSPSLVRKIDLACKKNNCREIFIAKDNNNHIHAGIYIVWDHNSAYYLMGGADMNFRGSGATSLLIWEAIKYASSVTKQFDFEGSMIEPIENFFRGFGAQQTPYFTITKFNSRILKFLYNFKHNFE